MARARGLTVWVKASDADRMRARDETRKKFIWLMGDGEGILYGCEAVG